MKITDIDKLHLLPKTKADIHIDVTATIVSDEFNRPGGNHRKAAIDRLIKEGLPFHNNCNLTYNLVEEFISVKCPYCKNQMKTDGGGGSSYSSSTRFICNKCKAVATITLDHDQGLQFRPKDY